MAFAGGTEGGRVDSPQQLVDIIKYGVVIASTLPILAVYPFIQKYFNKGVIIGSIKG
jgi:putative aldouronate transport system permease protein